MAHRLLLDTSSMMYRAFYGLPATIRDGEGKAVNAVYGYLEMTTRLLTGRRPDSAIHVYDDTIAPAERLRAFPSYKARRRPDPEELPWQFRLLQEVLDAFGIERAGSTGWEADDAIAALCREASGADVIEIVSGDRDLLQLVRDRNPVVRLLFTVRGVSKLVSFDEAAVLAKYGVPASRYVEFAILRGDPSDGLPGVRGIGVKTATELARSYETVDAMLAGADSLPGAVGARLLAAAEYIRAMREVVPLRADVTLERRAGAADPRRLLLLGRTHGLGGPIKRLAGALAIELPAG